MNKSVDIIMVTLANGKREVHVIESGLASRVETELKTNLNNPNMKTLNSMPLPIAQKLVREDKEASRIVDHTADKTFENPMGDMSNLFGDANPFDFMNKK